MGNRFTGATVRMCSTSVNRKLNLENSTCFLRHGLTNTPEADRIAAVAFRRDVGPSALLHGKLPDPVSVIAAVGKKH